MRREVSQGPGRKVALVLALAALASLGSLYRRWKRAEGEQMSAQDNKKIARQLLEEPWKGNLDVIDEYVDAKYIGYDASLPEPLRGVQDVKDFVQEYLNAFSDGRITVDDQIAEGDMVATRWTGRGTHDGELLGIAPTRKQVTVSGMTISRLANGKVVEEWSNWDTLGMLQQVGAVPEMAPAQ
jgi:predicted ester cyclase